MYRINVISKSGNITKVKVFSYYYIPIYLIDIFLTKYNIPYDENVYVMRKKNHYIYFYMNLEKTIERGDLVYNAYSHMFKVVNYVKHLDSNNKEILKKILQNKTKNAIL